MPELIWDGKYDKDGRKVAPLKVALPFQTVETVNESAQQRQLSLERLTAGRDPEWRNRLIWGDKKYVLPSLLQEFAGQVDLIYIDPPFDTGDDFSYYVEISDNGFTKEPSILETKAYRDTWGRGLESYLTWFFETCTLLRELLSEQGSIYVHLDWRVVHYAKVVMDDLFGSSAFRNEIIWRRARTHNDPNGYGRVHDTILFYARPAAVFHRIYDDYREEYLETAYRRQEADGRRYQLLPLHSTHKYSNTDDNTRRFGEKVLRPPTGKYWRWSQARIEEALKNDLIAISDGDVPRYKKYLDEAQGVPAQSIWDDLKYLDRNDQVGYPTQKPEELLKRIIGASSAENALVLDCFVGSGTTAVAAEKLGRRWIACDLGRFAIHTTRKRLLEVPDIRPFVVQNLGKYERQVWQGSEFGDEASRQSVYRNFILDLYKAQPVSSYTWLHGLKAGRMVHVGAVDAPVSPGDLSQIAGEFRRAIGSGKDAPSINGVDVLGWDFAFEQNEVAKQQVAQANIHMRFLRIPRDVMDKRAVEQGDVQFFELAALSTKVEQSKRSVTVGLTDFVIPPDDVPEDVRRIITHWEQWVDYWAVDWDNKGDTFHNQWQDYRTRKKRSLQLTASHTYEQPGDYIIEVKVIDILGNDTTKTLQVTVK